MNRPKVLMALIERGVEQQGRDDTPLHIASARGASECVDAILETEHAEVNELDRAGNSALDLAIQCGNVSVGQSLMKKGGLSFTQEYPVHWVMPVCEDGHPLQFYRDPVSLDGYNH